jgi:hypothetical protein
MGADKNYPQTTRPMSQSQLQKSHTNTNRQNNIVMDQLQVLGTIPRNTRGSTREEAKEPIELRENLRIDRTVPNSRGLSAREGADCPEDRARTVCSTTSRKIAVLSKVSAEWSVTPRGLSASRGLSAKHARTVRGRTEQKPVNSQERLPKVVPGSPKRLKL